MATLPAEQRLLPNRRILRYTYLERVMHWIAGLSYVYLMLTGLAFFTPWLFWIAIILGGGPTSRLWHPIIGLVFTAALLWMYRDWKADMKHTPEDAEWRRTMMYYIRNEDDYEAPAGRFNLGQKQFFWVMFWGGIILFLSGLVLWFPEYIPWSAYWVRHIAILLHVVGGLLTIGAFIIHFYMGTAVVREGFSSVIRGEVSEAWVRTHHPLWLKEITGETKK